MDTQCEGLVCRPHSQRATPGSHQPRVRFSPSHGVWEMIDPDQDTQGTDLSHWKAPPPGPDGVRKAQDKDCLPNLSYGYYCESNSGLCKILKHYQPCDCGALFCAVCVCVCVCVCNTITILYSDCSALSCVPRNLSPALTGHTAALFAQPDP